LAKAPKHPVTPAIRALRAAKVSFEPRLYAYEAHGGTQRSAAELGVEEHRVIKTIVLETEKGTPLIALMHGDLQVSTKKLARLRDAKSVRPCDPAVALKHTGYQVGGTSPFGTRRTIDVYMHEGIAALSRVLINGGKRGFLVELDPSDIVRVLSPTLADVAAS
jgi:Cys-tRNA(Pro) deacylase